MKPHDAMDDTMQADIAVLQGWTSICRCTCSAGNQCGILNLAPVTRHLPDYLGSLDAMRKVEHTLANSDQDAYRQTLKRIAGSADKAIMASARQRAMAYLSLMLPSIHNY